MRVEIIHSLAKTYYLETNDSSFRGRMTNGGHPFPFDTVKYDAMEKESCIVGMVMAWSVITLESLVNHLLAERLNNKNLAVMAIEYPRQITDKLKIAKSARSELAKKLIILADSEEENSQFTSLADELSETRNLILHDKPFELIDYGEGEVDMMHFRSRGDVLDSSWRYDDLTDFYEKCDKVKSYAVSIFPVEVMGVEEISFSKLVSG
ncbi:hypothetical protein [uncultured Shewanella sp.]|uniref:hypothetical protein n=1 Tax=uncultured Shewanella sp. TaxID=173975 RepID=UPI002623BA58|nr:hypothetical protein [uncultured Shewanella sp.]